MYRIAYIDDEADVVRQFKINTMDDFEVVDIELKDDIEDMKECIISSNISALVVDFLLNDTKSRVHYNGVELIGDMMDIWDNFPCFILTSYEIEAENTSINPDLIYPKSMVDQDPTRFNRKIKRKIENYYKEIHNAQVELIGLMKKSSGLSLADEEKMIELDDFLERVSNKQTSIPKHVKELSYNKRLNTLIDKTEQLLKEIKIKG